jgi:hypothetical protein
MYVSPYSLFTVILIHEAFLFEVKHMEKKNIGEKVERITVIFYILFAFVIAAFTGLSVLHNLVSVKDFAMGFVLGIGVSVATFIIFKSRKRN